MLCFYPLAPRLLEPISVISVSGFVPHGEHQHPALDESGGRFPLHGLCLLGLILGLCLF